MKVTIQMVIERDDEPPIVGEIACLERAMLTPDTLGLTLAETKTVLAQAAGHAGEGASGGLCCPRADLSPLRRAAKVQRPPPDRRALAFRQADALQPTTLHLYVSGRRFPTE